MSSASEESSILRRNISASFAIKGFALVVSFFSTSAYISFFSDDTILGVWFAVLSLLNWVLFFDFGLGNGLRNQLVGAWTKGDIEKARELISSAYVALGLPVLLLGVTFFFVSPLVPWNDLFSVSRESVDQDGFLLCVDIVVLGTLVQLWLRLITSVLYAFENTALPSAATLISNVAMLGVLLMPNQMNSFEKLLLISCMQVVSMNLPILLTSVWFFQAKHPEIKPRLASVTRDSARSVTMLGGEVFSNTGLLNGDFIIKRDIDYNILVAIICCILFCILQTF